MNYNYEKWMNIIIDNLVIGELMIKVTQLFS